MIYERYAFWSSLGSWVPLGCLLGASWFPPLLRWALGAAGGRATALFSIFLCLKIIAKMIARFRRKLSRNGYTKTWNMIRNCKMDQKKRRLENRLTKFTKTKKTHASKAWFSCPVSYGIVVSTFHDLFRLIQKSHPEAFEIEACRCFFHPKPGRREVWKTYKKQSPEK